MTTFLKAGIAAVVLAAGAPVALAAGDGPEIKKSSWNFGGIFGHFDEAQLQRGFLVYKEVCASCHGLKRVNFRNLVQKGGPMFPEESVKELAASWPNKVFDGPNDNGDIADRKGNIIKRPAKLSDPILGPYDNDQQARAAHNGALPPDLSLIARSRNVEYKGTVAYHPLSMARDIATGYQEGGADYIKALMTGYADQPPAYARNKAGQLVEVADKDVKDEKAVERCASISRGDAGAPDVCNKLQDGQYYNKYFPGGQIAMPSPLASPVAYQPNSGATSSIEQNAQDVAAFLSWTADPTLSERKSLGLGVLLYMLVTCVLLYIAKKRTWRAAH